MDTGSHYRKSKVTLAVDIMAINKIQFMITTSRDIHFGTAKLIRDNFIRYVEGNMIPNYNIIFRVEDMFGLNLGSLKGKTTRHLTDHVNVTWTQVPI